MDAEKALEKIKAALESDTGFSVVAAISEIVTDYFKPPAPPLKMEMLAAPAGMGKSHLKAVVAADISDYKPAPYLKVKPGQKVNFLEETDTVLSYTDVTAVYKMDLAKVLGISGT